MTEAEAHAAIEVVGAWLYGEARAQLGTEGMQNLARSMATELLQYADCDGLGGCILCQG